jgi:hypothetical protein
MQAGGGWAVAEACGGLAIAGSLAVGGSEERARSESGGSGQACVRTWARQGQSGRVS